MAPNFLSKFVKTNGTQNDGHPRSRTISDIGDFRARDTSSSTETVKSFTPSVVLTSENGNSPQQPSTPGSLHRSESPRRTYSVASLPATPIKELKEYFPPTTSPGSGLPVEPPMGLGIDLGHLPQLPEPALSHQPTVPQDNNATGADHLIKKRLSARSLKSSKNHKAQDGLPPSVPSASLNSTRFPPNQHASARQNPPEQNPPTEVPLTQEIDLPPKRVILMESPTSDTTPTTTSFVAPSEVDAITPSMSTNSQISQASLQPRSRDSDAVSISSAVSSNKKMPWRRGSAGSGKKRKPTGLASAIAASGLAMANPALTQSLAHFAPQPNSPPRSQQQSPPQSPPQSTTSRPRGTSNASHGRSATTQDENEIFYSDLDSNSEEDDLDDEIPVTGFAVASNKRNADFHDMFQQVPEGDYLIEDYGCALQREILIQGRLYISENHICFHANIFGWITDLIIPVYEIISIEKRMTALFIPNAIQITTRTSKYTFASFLSRDTTYDVIHNIWRLARPDADSIRSGDGSVRVSLDDGGGMLREGSSTTAGTSVLSPILGKSTQCRCGKEGEHYPETAMVAVFPGTPEKIYNLMFASGFIKDFLREEQKLKDLQISDWVPDPETQLLSRKLSYIKILNGVVKQTKCELLDETLHCDFDNYIVMLTTTRTPDVPSGNAFSVKTRTCLMWASLATTKVVVTTQVEWTGRSFIKSMINSSVVDGQKQYHTDLERAMRTYIAAHKNEFVPEGMEDVVDAPLIVDTVDASKEADLTTSTPLTEEEAKKKREHERNQRATQWAFDTIMNAWKVAKQSTLDALDLVSDAWDQSSSTTILYFLIVLLVLSNVWTFVMVGRREEVGRRKEMIKIDEQKKWVASIVAALTEDQQLKRPSDFLSKSVPATEDDWTLELSDLNKAVDAVEERILRLRQTLQDLD